MPQCFCLRILYAEKPLCSGVPEFAAYFRQAIQEVRGKPRSGDQAPVLPFRNLRFCWQKSECARQVSIFPRTSEIRGKTHCQKRKRDERPSEKSPLNAKTAFRRFPRTKPNVSSQGLITPITLGDNSQGRQSNTAKLSYQIVSPFMHQPFVKEIVSERKSPSRPIPTRSPVNRQSNPIVNR